jgi:amidase
MSDPEVVLHEAPLQRLRRADALEYDFAVQEPRLTVDPGETFELEVENSTSGRIRSSHDLPTTDLLGDLLAHGRLNPCAGPVHIRGAEPGDVLVVEIVDIVVAETGYALLEGIGPLAESLKYPETRGPYTHIIRHEPGPSGTTSDGTGHFDERTSWPLAPMIGTFGVVPDRPSAGSDTLTMQNRFGGNLDTREFRRGSLVSFPVAHPGALLYAGDVHASQATEFGGTGDESRAVLTLRCRLQKRSELPFVRVETPEAIIQLNSLRPIDEAIKQANLWMLDWLVEEYGLTPRDATLQLAVNPEVRNHIYALNMWGAMKYTVGVSFPKRNLRRGNEVTILQPAHDESESSPWER